MSLEGMRSQVLKDRTHCTWVHPNRWPDLDKLRDALRSIACPAMILGGAARDAFAGIPTPRDLDVCVDAHPVLLERCLRASFPKIGTTSHGGFRVELQRPESIAFSLRADAGFYADVWCLGKSTCFEKLPCAAWKFSTLIESVTFNVQACGVEFYGCAVAFDAGMIEGMTNRVLRIKSRANWNRFPHKSICKAIDFCERYDLRMDAPLRRLAVKELARAKRSPASWEGKIPASECEEYVREHPAHVESEDRCPS